MTKIWQLGFLYRYLEIIKRPVPKRPSRDACLYMGEATPPDPCFLFAIAAHP